MWDVIGMVGQYLVSFGFFFCCECFFYFGVIEIQFFVDDGCQWFIIFLKSVVFIDFDVLLFEDFDDFVSVFVVFCVV